MALYFGGAPSGVGPQKFDEKTDEILEKIENVDLDIAELTQKVNSLQIIVSDIYNGNQTNEWIANLAASGTNSETYNNTERMDYLITQSLACDDASVSKYLLQWAAANNKAHIFYKSSLGNTSTVTWDSLTSLNSIFSNSSALRLIANKAVTFTATCDVSSTWQTMATNYSVANSIISSSSVAKNVLEEKEGSNGLYTLGSNTSYATEVSMNTYMFVTRVSISCYGSRYHVPYKYYVGSTAVYNTSHRDCNWHDVYRFANKIVATPTTMGEYGTIVPVTSVYGYYK